MDQQKDTFDLPDGLDRDQLTRFVLEWCWLSDLCPDGIHDAAAMLLGEPSLAAGFAKVRFEKWLEGKRAAGPPN